MVEESSDHVVSSLVSWLFSCTYFFLLLRVVIVVVVCSEGAGGHQSGADRPERSSWRLGRHDRRRPVWLGHGHLQPGPSLRAVRSLSLFLARFCASMMVDPHRNQVKSWFFAVFFLVCLQVSEAPKPLWYIVAGDREPQVAAKYVRRAPSLIISMLSLSRARGFHGGF